MIVASVLLSLGLQYISNDLFVGFVALCSL